jgi:hypothetical protein
VDEQLENFCPMPLIGRHGEIDLDGPDDPRIPPRDKHTACTRPHARQHRIAPERTPLIERKRNNEADSGAVVHDCVQQLAQHLEVMFDGRGTGVGPPLRNLNSGEYVHDSLTGGQSR